MPIPEGYFTTQQVAERLGMHINTIWRYVKNGFVHPRQAIGGRGSNLRGKRHFLFTEADIRRIGAIYESRLAFLEAHGLKGKILAKRLDARHTPSVTGGAGEVLSDRRA
jgi:DNA-binding transcriptional MerR regulator